MNLIKKIQKNQFVVHSKYGIGRYKGLCTFKNRGKEAEYMIIEYADKEKLYVPIVSLYLISWYKNFSDDIPRLNKLGNKNWKKEKNKSSEKICDIAVKLIDIYSHRISKKGFSFFLHKEKYKKFCSFFPFKETIDQIKVMQEVLKDMQKNTPMDRLICGDVGVGKTEIAMRASFISVNNNKQVAILVPTTLLAQQHYYNFNNRFKNFPYKIKILTRFSTKQEENKILKKIKNGNINILIGTHKILSRPINWKNLGLLIIDEEHRFGVQQKEKIKEFYLNIDILTLSATPIPRTLSMALLGIKNLSIIYHPPKIRVTVKTFILKYDLKKIKFAILKEINRGGQVYYLYNKVKNIEEKAKILSNLIPKAKIEVGHGQMKNYALEKVMNNFLNKKCNVLVCTTIIDTGIDLSNVNTIIIENAEQFGLSQLYQLRGRVGRSSIQAYAWFFISNTKKIKEKSKKRLKVIKKIKNFGSGFSLSQCDSKIRGTGEILGNNQSGHINKIGFHLYNILLKKAINILKKKGNVSLQELNDPNISIEFHISALFPEKYILDINLRLKYYYKIANANTLKKLDDLSKKISKKFGKLPEFVKNLFILYKIRILSKILNIKKIFSQENNGTIEFYSTKKINVHWFSKKIFKEPEKWKIKNNIIFLKRNFLNDNKRIQWYFELLKECHKNNIII